MWPFSSIVNKINRFFPPTEKKTVKEKLQSELDEPRIGTGNKDGDRGFPKIGIKNSLLMFIITSLIVYLLTLFFSGIFGNKKVVTPSNLVQPSKINETQQNPASGLPSDYSGLPINPNNPNNKLQANGMQNGMQKTPAIGGGENIITNNQRAVYGPPQTPQFIDNGYRQDYRNGAIIDNGNVRGGLGNFDNTSTNEKNNWLTSSISFLAATAAVSTNKDEKSSPIEISKNNQTYQRATPNTIFAGSVIPVALINGITSDVSGDVVAQVRQDIYDSVTGDILLIPQGAKLLGSYEGKTTNGQSRLGVVFNRILFPDGHSINIDNQRASDDAGYPGLSDQVDNHVGRLIGGGIMTSVLAAAAQIAAGNTDTTNQTYGQLAVQGAATSIMGAGSKLLERDMQITPTITIRAGTTFTVFINKDIVIPSYN